MLTDDRIERYARHILLREVGGIGQERLLAARVELEGLQAAGWLVAWLALAGVGILRLRDGEPVGEEDVAPFLSRTDLGRPRAYAFAAAIPAFNPDVRVEIGSGAGADLRIAQGVPAEPGDALHWHATGDAVWVLPPAGAWCARCAATLPEEPATPAAAALAGSIAGGEALLALLGRAAPGRQAILFRGGEPTPCVHGTAGPGGGT